MSTPQPPRRRERHDTLMLFRLGGDQAAASAHDLASPPPPEPEPEPEPEPDADTVRESGPAPRARTPLHLWFKGLPDPVRARVEVGGTSMWLKTPLPFLELDSIVGLSNGEGESLLHGRLQRVQLHTDPDQLIPQLQIEVSLVDQGRSGLIEVPAQDPAQMVPIGELTAPAAPASEPPAIARRSRALPWLAGLVLGAAIGAGGTLAWIDQWPAAAALQARVRRAVDSRPVPAPTPRKVELPAVPAPLALEPALAQRLFEVSAPLALARGVEPPLALAEPTAAATAGESARAGSRVANPPGLPEVTVEGVRTRVFVPMRGDGEDLRQYELTTPGIAVTVPHARALIALDNYGIQRGLVRRVWLREEGAGVQVRVITRRPAARSIVSYETDGLNIVLEL